jgi:integrase
MANKVFLRKKQIANGKISLYLDYYPQVINPKTGNLSRREFLNLFIFNNIEFEEVIYKDKTGKDQKKMVPVLDKNGKPVTRELSFYQRQHNKEIMNIAEQILLKKEIELSKPEIYFGYELQQLKQKEKGEQNFVEYFKRLAEKRTASNLGNWISAYKYLETFTNGTIKFADLNESFCDDFKEYLRTTMSNRRIKSKLSQNSAVSYFNKIKAALRLAYRDGYLQVDLNARVDPIKSVETRRDFVTLEELNRLAKTDCDSPVLKRAALFSALTGLRFGDITNLKWENVEHMANSGYILKFTQHKTRGVETMPISDQAFSLMGERGNKDEQVFKDLTYSAYANKHLAKWIGLAGITKDITFHCFRHTFATLQLSQGTDIYTVSKMLGHRDIKTTQIYGKVMDQAKRTAANKIKLDF